MNNNYDMIDALSIASFIAQMSNMEEDKKYKDFIQQFAKAIQYEVDKLHAENDIIMAKLDRIMEAINNDEF